MTEQPRRTGDQPGGRQAAPGRLRLVQAFVNTRDIEGGEDALGTPEALATWLRKVGLAKRGIRADAVELAAAVELREALRALLLANNGGIVGSQAWKALNEAAQAARFDLRFSSMTQKPELEPRAAGMGGSIGTIVAIVAMAMNDGSWYRLKVCRRDACRWAFYDHSNAQSSIWCSMSICGNRTKVRRHRQRTKGLR
jgi:predicted RNA-binding Zn ribbon-like protein